MYQALQLVQIYFQGNSIFLDGLSHEHGHPTLLKWGDIPLFFQFEMLGSLCVTLRSLKQQQYC